MWNRSDRFEAIASGNYVVCRYASRVCQWLACLCCNSKTGWTPVRVPHDAIDDATHSVLPPGGEVTLAQPRAMVMPI